MKALIDTCVIIDVLQKREPYFNDSYSVFLAGANRIFDGSISAKSVTDIYYLMHRHFHNDVKSRQALDILFKLFSVEDTTGYDCKKALVSEMSDYEDAIMTETAIRIGADCIITRNLKDYSNSVITAYSPSDFLKNLNNQ